MRTPPVWPRHENNCVSFASVCAAGARPGAFPRGRSCSELCTCPGCGQRLGERRALNASAGVCDCRVQRNWTFCHVVFFADIYSSPLFSFITIIIASNLLVAVLLSLIDTVPTHSSRPVHSSIPGIFMCFWIPRRVPLPVVVM